MSARSCGVYGGLYQKSWTQSPIFQAQQGSLYPNITLKEFSTTYSDAHIYGQIPQNSVNSGSKDQNNSDFLR